MDREIAPFSYNGTLYINSSKSYFQRALAISCLTNSSCLITGFPKEDDIKVALGICSDIGLGIVVKNDSVKVIGDIPDRLESISINSGESGLSTRMFGVILSSIFDKTMIYGKGTINKREIDFTSLEALGVKIQSNNGYLPATITGRLCSGIINIDGSKGSQLLSGLLIALPFLEGDSEIYVSGLVSKPYTDMTIEILNDFGIKVINDDYLKFSIVGNQISKTRKYNVEGDWSSAAFHFVGAAISGSVKIYGLKITSLQADRAIIDVLKSCGAKVVLNDDFIIINRNRLNAFVFDANNCPDLFPALVVLAACCDGRSIIYGVERLSNKESNRALTLKLEFKKLGVQISIDGNKMFIDGGHKISGGHVKSHGDHRIAMALSVITSVSESSIIINDSEVISKSYSNFYSDLLFVSS